MANLLKLSATALLASVLLLSQIVVVRVSCQGTNNNPPTFTAGPDVTWYEDKGAYNLQWTTGTPPSDSDGNTQGFRWLITVTPTTLFQAQPQLSNSGFLSFIPAPHQYGQATVTVQMSDFGATACANPATCTCNGVCNLSQLATFIINIIFVNIAPTFSTLGGVTVTQNLGAKSVPNWAYSINNGATNVNEQAQTLTFNVVCDNTTLFSQLPNLQPDGTLTFTTATNWWGVAACNVTAQDNGGTANGGSDTSVIYKLPITITYVNQQPYYSPGVSPVTVYEDSGSGSVIWATGISPGSTQESTIGQTIEFTLQWANPTCANLFDVQPAMTPTGNLSWTVSPDKNTPATLSCLLYVQITDNDRTNPLSWGTTITSSQTLQFVITPVNDPPYFTPGYNLTVWEDMKNLVNPPAIPASDTVLNWASGISPGNTWESSAEGQTVYFIFRCASSTLFYKDPQLDSSGTLTFTLNPYQNGYVTCTITIYDNLNMRGNTTYFSLTVLSVNNAPSYVLATTVPITVPQDCVGQTINPFLQSVVVAPAQATDEYSAQSVAATSTTVSQPSLFSVQPTVAMSGTGTAKLTFTCAKGQSGSTNLTAVVSDNGGTLRGGQDTATYLFWIVIVPNIIPPQFNFTSTKVQIFESQCDAGCSYPNFALNVLSGMPDSTSPVTFSVSTGTPSLFTILPAISAVGTLTFTTAPTVNGDSQTAVTATCTASGLTSTPASSFLIQVLPVNSAPSFVAGPDLTASNAPSECQKGAAAADTGCVHTYPGWATSILKGTAGTTNENSQTLTFTVVVPPIASSLFTTDGIQIDPATGTMTFTLVTGGGYQAAFTLSITLKDNGGTAFGGKDTFTAGFQMAVLQIYTAPAATVSSTITLYQDSGAYNGAILTALDPGTLPGTATISSAISFLATADTPALFSVQPTLVLTSSATASLLFTVALYQVGTTTITITVRNSATNLQYITSVVVTLVAFNHAPSFTLPASSVTVKGNSGLNTVASFATNVVAGPGAEPTTQTVTLNVWCDAAARTLFVSGSVNISAAGTLSFVTVTGNYGTSVCNVYASDNGGTVTRPISGLVAPASVAVSPAVQFSVTVSPVNTAPSFTAGANPSSYQGQGLATFATWATAIRSGSAVTPLINVSNSARYKFTVTCTATADTIGSPLFTLAPTIDVLTGTLQYATSAAVYGTIACTAILSDSQATDSSIATSATAVFSIGVLRIDTLPTFVASTTSFVTAYNATQPTQTVAAWATSVTPGGNAASTVFVVTSRATSTATMFVGSITVSATTGLLTYTLSSASATAGGTEIVDVCLQSTGGQYLGQAGNVSSITSVGQYCIAVTFVVQATASGPVIVLSTTTVTFLENLGQTSVASTTVLTTQTTPKFVPQMVLGATAQRSSSSTFISTLVTCSACTQGSTSVGWSTLFRTGPTITVRKDTSVSTAAAVFVGDLTVNLATNGFGTCSCTIQATDSSGDSGTSAAFSITVVQVNQIPSFSLLELALIAPSKVGTTYTSTSSCGAGRKCTVAGWASYISVGPAPEPSQQQATFTLTWSNSAVAALSSLTLAAIFAELPTVSPSTGDLTYRLANGTGTLPAITFTVSLSDSGGVANGGVDTTTVAQVSSSQTTTVVLSIVPLFVNSGPQVTIGSSVSIQQTTASTTLPNWLTISNGDGQPLSQVSCNATADLTRLFSIQPSVDVTTGSVSFTPAGLTGTARVTVVCTNQGGTLNGGVNRASVVGTIVFTPGPSLPFFSAAANPVVLTAGAVRTVQLFTASTLSLGRVQDGTVATLLAFTMSTPLPQTFVSSYSFGTTGLATLSVLSTASGTYVATVTLNTTAGTYSQDVNFFVNAIPQPATVNAAVSSVSLIQGDSALTVTVNAATGATTRTKDSSLSALATGAVTVRGLLINISAPAGAVLLVPSVTCNDTTAFINGTIAALLTGANATADVRFSLDPTFFGVVSCVAIVNYVGGPSYTAASAPFTLWASFVNMPPTVALSTQYLDAVFGTSVSTSSLITVNPGSAREASLNADAVATVAVSITQITPITLATSDCFSVAPTVAVVRGGDPPKLSFTVGYAAAVVNVSFRAADTFGATSAAAWMIITIRSALPSTPSPSLMASGRAVATAVWPTDISTFSSTEFAAAVVALAAQSGYTITTSDVTILSVKAGSTIVQFRIDASKQTTSTSDTILTAVVQASLTSASSVTMTIANVTATTTTAAPNSGTETPSTSSDSSLSPLAIGLIVVAVVLVLVLIGVVVYCVCSRRRQAAKMAEVSSPKDGKNAAPPTATPSRPYEVEPYMYDTPTRPSTGLVDPYPASAGRQSAFGVLPFGSQEHRKRGGGGGWDYASPPHLRQPYPAPLGADASRMAHYGGSPYAFSHHRSFAQPVAYSAPIVTGNPVHSHFEEKYSNY